MAEEDQFQQHSLGDSSSIEALKEKAILMLENECLALEKEHKRKKADNAALRRTIEKQDENNLKMQAEAEQLKVKIHKEIIGRETCEAKLNTLSKECQALEKNLSLFCKAVNKILKTIDHQKEILKQKGKMSKKNEDQCNQIQENYQRVLLYVSQTAKELAKLKTHEKSEFDKLICHLREEIKDKKGQVLVLNERYQQVDTNCKDTKTKIQLLLPQKTELENMVKAIESEMARQGKSYEREDASLKAALQEEGEKKAELTKKISKVEKDIEDTNVVTRDLENDAKELEATLKQLISENDELEQSNKSDSEELKKLAQEVEEKTAIYNSLATVDEENALLIKERDNLMEVNADLEKKIDDKRNTVQAQRIHLEKMGKFIQEMEIEKGQVTNEKFAIEERIKQKELDITQMKNQHKENCIQLDEEHLKLSENNKNLKKIITERAEVLSNLEKEKEKINNKLNDLKVQLNKSKKKRDDSFDEYLGFMREKEAVVKHLSEEITTLELTVGWSYREAEKALTDKKSYKEVNKRINNLEEELVELEEKHDSALKDIHEENSIKIKEKQSSLKALQAQKESEFRRKEVVKTNTRMELAENKRFIEEMEKSKQLTVKEIKKTESNLKKCEKLVRTLQDKLDTVIRVASLSQSTLNSDVSNLLTTPKYNNPQQSVYNSPISDSSSGITVNPDVGGPFGKQITKLYSAKKIAVKRKNKKLKVDED